MWLSDLHLRLLRHLLIYSDDPAPATQVNSMSSAASALLFTFPGHVAGFPAGVLVDSGATHSFCDHAFAKPLIASSMV